MWIFSRLTIRIFIIFSLTLTFFLVLIITIPTLDSRNLSSLSGKEKEMGDSIALSIEKNLTKVPKDNFRWWMRFIVTMNDLQRPREFLYVITPNDQIITSDTSNVDIIRSFSDLSKQTDKPAKKIYGEYEVIGPFLIQYSDESYRLYILEPASDKQSQFVNMIFDHPFLLLSLTMLASSPLLLWLSSSIAKPARQLKKAADQVARGNIQEWPELEKIGSLELKATGVSFNHMLRELKRMQELQQRLFSDISHELRTPLTRLQLAASLIRRKQGESKEIIRIETESKKLDEMIGELLLLAREQYTNNEAKEIITINQLCECVLDNADFEAKHLGKSFTQVSYPTNDNILCYCQALRSALENVIRNAFRYSHHLIEVRFVTEDNLLTIMIDDDGPGVDSNELKQIFRPFYRTSEARDRESGGTGLGLAIVANSITQDNGQVYAEKSHLGGLRIVITLPLYKS